MGIGNVIKMLPRASWLYLEAYLEMSYWHKIDKRYEGNMAKFARDMGVSRQLVFAWRKQGYIPVKRARKVERVMGGVVSAMEVMSAACSSGKS